jgi:hypothetical protein
MTALGPAWLDDQLDLGDFHRVPVGICDLVLEIAQAVPMTPRLGRMVVLEGFFEAMPVAGAVGALRPVGHDDVGVTVRLLSRAAVRVLDHFDEPVDVRILAEVMAMDVFVVVPVRHRPMLPVDRRAETAAGQEQPDQPRRG